MRSIPAGMMVLLALIALLVPSAAIGGRGFSPAPESTYTRTAEGGYVRAPCLLKSGKHVSCPRPDLGVLPAADATRIAGASGLAMLLADPEPAARAIAPSLPPPRRG
jgi:hypothetical protein